MIQFEGPAFEKVDNRLISLQLVERGLTNAAMFTPDGEQGDLERLYIVRQGLDGRVHGEDGITKSAP